VPGIVKIAFLADVGPAKVGVTQFASTVEDSVDRAGKAFGGLKDKLKIGALAGGAAVVAGLNEALDVGAVQDKLVAQLGLTGPAAEKVGTEAGNLYKNGFGASLEDAGDIVKNAFQNGLVGINDSADAVEAVGEQIANYTTLTGEDALKATEAVAQMIKTGLAKNATQAFDILNRGQQLGVNKAEDLLDTFNEYGTQFRKIGLDGPKALGLMSQGLKAGARDSDTVADAIKEFAIRSVDGSKTTVDAFTKLGLSAGAMQKVFAEGGPKASEGLDKVLTKLRDVEDPAERSRLAVELFGTKAEDLGDALLALDPSTAVAGLGDLEGAAKRAGDTLNDNAKARVTSFTRTLKTDLVNFLGAEVLPKLDEFGQYLQTKVGPKLKDLSDKVVPKVKTAVKELGDLWEDNKTKVGDLVTNLGKLADNIDKKVEPALANLGPPLKVLAELDLSSTIETLESANRMLSGTSGDQGGVSGFGDKLKDLGAIAQHSNLPAVLGKLASDSVNAFLDKFTKDSSYRATVGNWLKDVGTILTKSSIPGLALQAGKDIGTKLIDGLTGTSGSAKGRATAFMQNLGKFLNFANPIGGALATGQSLGTRLVDGLAGSSGSAKTRAVTFMGNLGKFLDYSNPIGAAKQIGFDLGSKLVDAIKDGGGNALGAVKKFITGIPGDLANAGGDFGGALISAGRAVISGLIDGIQSKIPSLGGVLGGVTNYIKEHKGPPQVDKVLLTPAGQQIMQGLIKGIESQRSDLQRQLDSVTGQIEGGLTSSPQVTLTAAGAFASSAGALATVAPVQIIVQALAAGPEVGRQVKDALLEYEQFNGTSWRAVPA
jgi:minor tail protein